MSNDHAVTSRFLPDEPPPRFLKRFCRAHLPEYAKRRWGDPDEPSPGPDQTPPSL
ncbi:hypothetical protein [Nocardia wallacei]|uniref:hypothetical protein n=1 Tax=Nocardia wallacei TaxID=480035 RepID=UPI002457D86D|nr:hypothetical protein [Nocardia wallacei]